MEYNTQNPTVACRMCFSHFPFSGSGLRVNASLGSSESASGLERWVALGVETQVSSTHRLMTGG